MSEPETMNETEADPHYRDLLQAYADHDAARERLIEAAIAAHLGGVSANEIARLVATVPGLNRNKMLAILAAGRRAAAARAVLDEGEFGETWVHHPAASDRVSTVVRLCSRSAEPLGPAAAHRLWTALARKGLTVDADDPETALAELTANSSQIITASNRP